MTINILYGWKKNSQLGSGSHAPDGLCVDFQVKIIASENLQMVSYFSVYFKKYETRLGIYWLLVVDETFKAVTALSAVSKKAKIKIRIIYFAFLAH